MYLAYYEKTSIKGQRREDRQRKAWINKWELSLRLENAIKPFYTRDFTCGKGIPTFVYVDCSDNHFDVYHIEVQQDNQGGFRVFGMLNRERSIQLNNRAFETLGDVVSSMSGCSLEDIKSSFYGNEEGLLRDDDSVFYLQRQL